METSLELWWLFTVPLYCRLGVVGLQVVGGALLRRGEAFVSRKRELSALVSLRKVSLFVRLFVEGLMSWYLRLGGGVETFLSVE